MTVAQAFLDVLSPNSATTALVTRKLRELTIHFALITIIYQSNNAAEHSTKEHAEILKAIVAKRQETGCQTDG
jgi:hypothetical protein